MNKTQFNIISSEVIKWCLYAIIFAAPFSKSISEFSISLAISLWIFKKVLNRDIRLEKTGLNIAFLIFLLSIVPSFVNSSYSILSIRAYFTKVLKFVLLYFIIVENINTRAILKDLFIIAFISISIITIDGFIQYYITGIDVLHYYPSFKIRFGSYVETPFKGFPTASFPFPNDLAAWILLVIFPLACSAIFDLKNSGMRYIAALVSAGLFYLFFLTKARGAWLGFSISTVYVALSQRKLWLILLLILVITLPFILKMEMAGYIFAPGSVQDRQFMWKTSWQIFKEHPIIGNGINTFFEEFKKYREDKWQNKKGSYAHNCYIQMAADCGVVGLAAFLWLMCSYFLSIARGLKKVADEFYRYVLLGISLGVFAFLVHSFFDTNLYSLNLATLFWCAIALSQSILKVFRTEDE